MFSYLSRRIVYNLAKWSKPKPKANKVKETKKSFAVGDEKAAKLSKSEQELENKQKMLEKEKLQAETKRQFEIYRRHDISLEEYMPEQEIEYLKRQQYIHLKNITQKKKEFQPEEPIDENKAFYLPTDQAQLVEQGVRKKKQPAYGNYTQVINKAYDGIEEFEGHELMRRIGTLGVKLGMTTMWDKWGHVVPVTVVELDRVQVVQIKEPVKGNEFYQVQMGIGEKKLKKLTKPLLGHFVKARVPPKKVLAEFQVSKECLLPVGYMMTPRHYTPGMFVDVVGRTVGHGFQGTIKKYGFSRQPASHGNSVTTRVLGSTGGRQDPGRVFKQKKMYGQMGNRITTQSGLEVFKIDIDKNIVYLKGSVPGKPGTIIKMRDSLLLNKAIQNLELVHFPTFVEKEGVQYPRQMSRYCGERDPGEIQIHDNAFIIDDGEEQAEVSDKPEGEEAME